MIIVETALSKIKTECDNLELLYLDSEFVLDRAQFILGALVALGWIADGARTPSEHLDLEKAKACSAPY